MGAAFHLVVLLLLGNFANHSVGKHPGQKTDKNGGLAVPDPPQNPPDPSKKVGDIVQELWDRRNGCIYNPEVSTTEPFVETRSDAAIIVQSVSMVIIIAGSILGNALILTALCKTRCLQNKTSVFVANVAIADLLNALLSMPFMLVNSIVGFWRFNDALCSFSGAMAILMCTTSINTLAVIAYERHSAIVYPLKYHYRITNSRIAALISWTWIQGFVTSMCPILGWSQYIYLDSAYMCIVDWGSDTSFTFTLITFNFGIPFLVMVYCYGHIFRVARRHSRRVADFDVSTNSKSSVGCHHGSDNWKTKRSAIVALAVQRFKKEAKAATILMIVMGAFLACWIPQGCTMICLASGDYCLLDMADSVYTTTTWLATCASFCNPLVYGVLNRHYREAYYNICCSVCPCPKACKPPSSSQSETSTENKKKSKNTPHNHFDVNPQTRQVFVIIN